VRFVARRVEEGCETRDLALPILHLEPGRSLVARAGVALYRVGAVKQTPHRRWLLLDGGMADNIRPALYGARYSALPVADPMRPTTGAAWLAGPFCESGDVLIHDLPMPEIGEGELIAVPASGAYHLMMGSNYNGALKPAIVWIHEGKARLIQRREEIRDLIRRDLPLETESE
jgi:diaminopimelate decarboxylase